MKISAISKNTMILDRKEFKKFLIGKMVYHHNVHWIEKWSIKAPSVLDYIPSDAFLLERENELEKYPHPGYGTACLGVHVKKNGKGYWEVPHWAVSIVTTAGKTELPKEKYRYYVTRKK